MIAVLVGTMEVERGVGDDVAAGAVGAAAPGVGARAWAWARRHRRLVLVVPVMLVAFGVRLVAVYDALPGCGPGGQAASPRPCFALVNDSAYYLDQARALEAGAGFIDPAAARAGIDAQGAAHPPLYPMVLAAAIRAGYTDENALRVLGAAIGALGVGLVGLVAARAAGRLPPGREAAVAVTAATIAALYPPLWLADVRLQAEVLVLPLTATLVLVALGPARRPAWPAAAALGAVGGLLTLARQDGVVVFVAVVVALALGAWRSAAPSTRSVLVATGAAVGAFAVVVSPWIGYNLARFPEPVGLTTGSSVVALYGTCDQAWTGDSRGTYDYACVPATFSTASDESELSSWTRHAAIDHATSHLTEVPGILATRAARLWQLYAPFDTAERDATLEGRGQPWPLLGTWATWLLLPAATVGAVAAHRRRTPLGPLLAVPVATTVVAMASFALTRYRAPAEVVIVALAAVGAEATWRRTSAWWHDHIVTDATSTPRRWARTLTTWAWTLPVLLTALTVRLAAVLVWRPDCTFEQTIDQSGGCYQLVGDASYYYQQAAFLAAGSGFRTGAQETAQHPPLFPLLLAALRKVGIESLQQQRLALAVLGALAAVLVGLVGHRIGGRGIGLLAGLGAALLPNLWLADSTLMSESLLVLMTSLVLLAAYRLHRTPTLANGALLGLTIGLIALTRTENLLLFVVLVPPLLWRVGSAPGVRRLALGGVVLATTVLVVLPWVGTNLRRFDEPVLFTTNVGQTLLYGACDDAFSGPGAGAYSYACFSGSADEPNDESQLDRQHRTTALDYYRDHAGELPRVLALRALRTWNLTGQADIVERDLFLERRGRAALMAGMAAAAVATPAAVYGIVLLRRRRIPVSPLLAFVALATVTAVIATPVPRFRVSADVALIVAAAAGLHALAFGSRSGEPAETARRTDEPAQDG